MKNVGNGSQPCVSFYCGAGWKLHDLMEDDLRTHGHIAVNTKISQRPSAFVMRVVDRQIGQRGQKDAFGMNGLDG